MRAELRTELTKLLHKSRTYAGPAGMAFLVTVTLLAMKYGHDFQRHVQNSVSQDFIMSGSPVNAVFLSRFMLSEFVVYMFLPIFACTVLGDLLASEAADGTLRTMLCRPVTRFGVLSAKYAVGCMYVLALTFGTGLAAYLAGAVFLGRGALLSLGDGIWILTEQTAILRLVAGYGLVAVGMIAVGSIAFLISTFISNSNGAVAGAMGLLIVSSIIGQLEFFSKLKPYLLTTYLPVSPFFGGRFDASLYTKCIVALLAYSAISFAASVVIFHRKDVLS